METHRRTRARVGLRWPVGVSSGLCALTVLAFGDAAPASSSLDARTALHQAGGGHPDLYRLRPHVLAAIHKDAPRARTCFMKNATIAGTSGDDHLVGTRGDDVIIALGGEDRIEGRGGNDTICGGGGSDREAGGAGGDAVGGDDDQIFARAEQGKKTSDRGDAISGGPGKDFIQSGDGHDVDNGGPGPDTVNGERGPDLVKGGKGNDFVGAALTPEDPDHDRLLGNTGDDVIGGAAAGDDRLRGGRGDDQLQGGLGNDRLVGGPGADKPGRFLFGDRELGDDLLLGGSGGDLMHSSLGRDRARGGRGQDKAYGQSGGDDLRGNAGPDRLVGGAGVDEVHGGVEEISEMNPRSPSIVVVTETNVNGPTRAASTPSTSTGDPGRRRGSPSATPHNVSSIEVFRSSSA